MTLSIMTLVIVTLSTVAERCYDVSFLISVTYKPFMLSVVMLSVVLLSVIMLSDMAQKMMQNSKLKRILSKNLKVVWAEFSILSESVS